MKINQVILGYPTFSGWELVDLFFQYVKYDNGIELSSRDNYDHISKYRITKIIPGSYYASIEKNAGNTKDPIKWTLNDMVNGNTMEGRSRSLSEAVRLVDFYVASIDPSLSDFDRAVQLGRGMGDERK